MFKSFFYDRKSRLARIWSNEELKKFAPHLSGHIVNVSGWKDEDKQGVHYQDYFINQDSYSITNYEADARGFQGKENELFLDLTKPLPNDLQQKYDVVLNHTVLEHIFEVDTAFSNLCQMSKDVVIVVVPFLQPMHADYGDFWRFTPTCLQKLFEKNNYKVIYSSFNDPVNASVYVFCVAVRNPEKWAGKLENNVDDNGNVNFLTKPLFDDGQTPMVGANVIVNFGAWLSLKYNQFRLFIKTRLNK